MEDPEVVEDAALDRLLRIGGQEFLLEMIDLFLAHAPERIRSARQALEAGDHRTLYRAAHSLKSTAGNMGARGLQGVAERVEGRAAAKDLESIAPLLQLMAEQYDGVRDRLEAERKRRSGG
ncbi:MAG TPA: Hpt domain-containing protein [Longimicrobiales bacterium]|nr:Hpt domain-containing protein [Longimicrobiales bacterium]